MPNVSRAERATSFLLDDFRVPAGREEEWKFTPLNRVAPLFDAAGTVGPLAVDVPLTAGLTHERGATSPALAFVPADRAAAVAWEQARAVGGVDVLTIAPEQKLDPVRVSLRATEARSASHLLVQAGAYSSATIVLEHTGGGVIGSGVEVVLGEGAHLTLVSVQSWDADAVHAAQHDALVGRDATLKHVVVSLGGSLVRVSSTVRYGGTGGDASLLGVYFADAGQHLEHRSFVDHEASNCRSRVTYKGALQGESARTVWVGDVLIRASALGTDTYELNRNLVLTDGARADSVPNLEIETGEIVGAGHASATGRFDDEQLFYLQSRGIPEAAARRMVVRAFFADLLQQIGVPAVTTGLVAAIDIELGFATEDSASEDSASVDSASDDLASAGPAFEEN